MSRLSELKKWLEKSGIRSLNSFDVVIENPSYPLARVYRESVWTGIIDTYEVLVGDHYDLRSTGNGRVGILDLFIFPLIALRLIKFAFDSENPAFFRIMAGLLGFLLEIPRVFLGILLTLILIPIVFLIHGIAYFKAYPLIQEAGALLIEEIPRDKGIPNQKKTLSEYLSEHHAKLCDIKYSNKLGGGEQTGYRLKFHFNINALSTFRLHEHYKRHPFIICEQVPQGETAEEVICDANNAVKLKAFEALNVGGKRY